MTSNVRGCMGYPRVALGFDVQFDENSERGWESWKGSQICDVICECFLTNYQHFRRGNALRMSHDEVVLEPTTSHVSVRPGNRISRRVASVSRFPIAMNCIHVHVYSFLLNVYNQVIYIYKCGLYV